MHNFWLWVEGKNPPKTKTVTDKGHTTEAKASTNTAPVQAGKKSTKAKKPAKARKPPTTSRYARNVSNNYDKSRPLYSPMFATTIMMGGGGHGCGMPGGCG